MKSLMYRIYRCSGVLGFVNERSMGIRYTNEYGRTIRVLDNTGVRLLDNPNFMYKIMMYGRVYTRVRINDDWLLDRKI